MDFRVLNIVWELNGNIEQCTMYSVHPSETRIKKKQQKKNVAATSSIRWLWKKVLPFRNKHVKSNIFGVQNYNFRHMHTYFFFCNTPIYTHTHISLLFDCWFLTRLFVKLAITSYQMQPHTFNDPWKIKKNVTFSSKSVHLMSKFSPKKKN